jgi:conjugal transfer pilus assembly protein TraB
MAFDAKTFLHRLTPKQQQYLKLGGIGLLLFGTLWAVFALTEDPHHGARQVAAPGQQKVTNVGVMAPGAQLDPRETWIGEAGKEVAQLKMDRDQQRSRNEAQEQLNRDLLNRIEALRHGASQPAQPAAPAPVTSPDYPPGAALAAVTQSHLPPPPPPPRPGAQATGVPPGAPPGLYDAPQVGLVRVSLQDGAKGAAATPGGAQANAQKSDNDAQGRSVDNYLPVSFTRALMLGGLDAPTGGQSQTNPQPVLLKLEDNAILPNRFRSQVRECFVIGAGYGDISSERAYIRTESLSCIRHDGSTLEVKIQGSIFGEDGKVGMRGRLVTKQGQMLANALIAGVVSGIGQGFQTKYTTTTTSTFGTISTPDSSHAFEAGIGTGVGQAMERLADYYIRLAEKTFPVIEVDAGRVVDVVLTKGVLIDAPVPAGADARPTGAPSAAASRTQRVWNDENDE